MARVPSETWIPLAGALGWLVPGAGHLLIGERARALIFFVALELTFWVGVAVSGFSIFDHAQNRWWFLAHLLNGVNGLGGWAAQAHWSSQIAIAYGKSWDVGNIYCGVAGLLNLLVAIDAMARAERLGAKS
jgi:hypothetical protein